MELPTTAGKLATMLGAKCIGNSDAVVESFGAIQSASAGSLCYLADAKFKTHLTKLKEVTLLIREELVDTSIPVTYLVVENPKSSFATLARAVFQRDTSWGFISEKCYIDPSAVIADGVKIGPFSYVGPRTKIARNAEIFPNVYLGADCIVGENSVIHPNVTIWDRVEIGSRVKIFSGTVIGSDGFGLVTENGKHQEVPQIGNVVIEDDVRVGANCTIDRATIAETRIKQGAKIDNLVHIAHNNIVGAHSVICAQVGLSGSVEVGHHVVIAGQVGVTPGITIGDMASVGAQSGVNTNIPAGEAQFGSPAIPIKTALRVLRYMRKLPEIWDRLQKLEKSLGGK